MGIVFYLAGGETKVYHAHMNCPALNYKYRYWHLHEIRKAVAEQKGLRPCKRCHSYSQVYP